MIHIKNAKKRNDIRHVYSQTLSVWRMGAGNRYKFWVFPKAKYRDTISLSRHEQVCLMAMFREIFLSSSGVVNLLYYGHWADKWKYFYVYQNKGTFLILSYCDKFQLPTNVFLVKTSHCWTTFKFLDNRTFLATVKSFLFIGIHFNWKNNFAWKWKSSCKW